MYLSFEEICDNNGYQFESHFTTTDDGYILNLFRVPGRVGEPQIKGRAETKSPVFFQHGIVDSADAFIVNTADRSLAFLAADAGYDVWFGNLRGNKYSRSHERLNPDIDAA
jgi:pimeloyl-ACP methyl ester carboxylesterase